MNTINFWNIYIILHFYSPYHRLWFIIKYNGVAAKCLKTTSQENNLLAMFANLCDINTPQMVDYNNCNVTEHDKEAGSRTPLKKYIVLD